MQSNRFLIILCIVVVSLSIIYSIDNKKSKNTKSINLIQQNRISDNIAIPLIDEEDIPIIVSSTTKPAVAKPKKDLNKITSEAYLVGNLDNGDIYLEYNSNKVYPIASLSKLFTAIVAIHNIDEDKKIIIDDRALESFGDAGHLVLGEKFTYKELLYPLLLESSNDAAEALASSTMVYSEFIKLMNKFAKDNSMFYTSFGDASGLSSLNKSNAGDLFILARYLYKNEKDLLNTTRLSDYTLSTTTEHNSHHFISINPFTPYEPFIGGKTGRTQEAKESMVSLFNYSVNSKQFSTSTIPIAVIILRSDFGEREMDTERILEKLGKKLNN